MYEIIYNIYIWDYHYETCIDKEWLSIILHKAKQDFPWKEIRVVKENIPIEQIHKMIQDKIDDNERVWEEAKKTDDVIWYVNRYWARKDFDSLRLAFLNT
jgi:hypothetical protein